MHRRAAPAQAPAGGVHGRVGLGQVVAGVRHAVRRGTAPLRRVAVVVRAPVPGPDGEAQVRAAARPVADDRDRAEVGVVEPALDGGHGHRDLRLPARALRPRGRAALPPVRRRGHRALGGRDRRGAADAAAAHQGGADGAQGGEPQGRVPRGVRGGAQGRLRARAHQRPDPAARRRHRARQEEEAHHRDRDRPRDDRSVGSRAPDRLGRGGGEGGRRLDPGRRRRRGARARLQRGARLPELRRRPARAVAAVVLVQQPARHVRRLQRPGLEPGGRPRSHRPQPGSARSATARSSRGATAPGATTAGPPTSPPPCRASSASRSTSRGRA